MFILVGNFALLVVVEKEYLLLSHVKLSFADLTFFVLSRVKAELLSHLLDGHVFFHPVVKQNEVVLASSATAALGLKSYTSVAHVVFSSFVALKGLPADVLLSVDEAIVVSVMVEIKFSVLSINLHKLLPVVRVGRTFIVLNQFELVGEPSSESKLVFPAGVVGPDFFNDEAFEVFEDSYAFDESIDLLAFGVEIDLTFLVEKCLTSSLSSIREFVRSHYKFGRPWGRHV